MTLVCTGIYLILFIQIDKGHQSNKQEILEDFCDGQVFKTHKLFSLHYKALQLFFYFDDVEMCNPLGSKTKTHKLSKHFQISKHF